MSKPLFFKSAAELNHWFSQEEPGRAHLEIDYTGDPVGVAVGLVRLAATSTGGLALVRGRVLTDNAERLTRVVRESAAEVCPGAVSRVDPMLCLVPPAVVVIVRPGALTAPSPVPPELRPALGFSVDDLDPEGIEGLQAATEAAPLTDWPANAAGRERALFSLGLARVFAGALVPTVAAVLVVGGPSGEPPEGMTVRYEPPNEEPRAHRLWLPEHLACRQRETWAWEGLSEAIAGWALAAEVRIAALGKSLPVGAEIAVHQPTPARRRPNLGAWLLLGAIAMLGMLGLATSAVLFVSLLS